MRIEDFQQLDITGNQRNQIPPVFSLQLCRTEPAKSRKYLMPDDCQQLKRDIMIAFLLKVVENSPKNSQAD